MKLKHISSPISQVFRKIKGVNRSYFRMVSKLFFRFRQEISALPIVALCVLEDAELIDCKVGKMCGKRMFHAIVITCSELSEGGKSLCCSVGFIFDFSSQTLFCFVSLSMPLVIPCRE